MHPSADLLQPFLDDIVANPTESSLWLILADWLEDRDDPRSELVRLSWGLRQERDHPDFEVRQARLQELLAGGMLPPVPVRTLEDFTFAWIPPGSFCIGSPVGEARRFENESQREVTLTRGFWMGVHEVTQGQWQRIIGTTPAYFSRTGRYADRVKKISAASLASFPIENVSWDEMQTFLARLGEQLGQQFRLPTEAEWEYACRAGTTSTFHFGPALNGRQARCNGREPYGTKKTGPAPGRPAPVGSYPPNAFGLYDMHGNVYELCQDMYEEDPTLLGSIDPVWTEGDAERRVLRGGCWQDAAWGCRAAFRYGVSTDEQVGFNGFRVVLGG
jgi:uncharacterized protein (TIGR02996 family)